MTIAVDEIESRHIVDEAILIVINFISCNCTSVSIDLRLQVRTCEINSNVDCVPSGTLADKTELTCVVEKRDIE